ncbi:MAG TPA: carbohydrate ABC transporter substrate-binding protein [Candidatus Limivivens merdigallinarum]|uniref:Carbohydrate ABC transporter substrate-binding protein n=1 Tax=Candidatus Limivivens merdigallinarum TaxID=2840859 RepID=A0A9D1D1G5_9FIRM|nr:carbohydrate ABC transporter substrate-binding protein [Candidatus Limivivens merdigallinarum]
MRKKLLSVLMSTCMAAGLLAGSGAAAMTAEAAEGEKTKITVYLGGDAADENQKIIETFNEQSDTIEAEMVTLTEGSSGYEMLTVMYNAGNPPTVYFMEAGDVLKLTDKLTDLSDMECLQYANEGTTEDVTVDGVVYGIPANLQAYGIMYNKRVLESVMGADFDPSTITTREEFKEVCDKVQEAGIAPVAISPFDWNLGNHWFNQVYSGQSENREDRDAFVQSLREGTADLENNEIFNDYMDTFDLLMEYNYYKDNPLETVADGNEKQAQLMALDQVAFWFHGNWATANLRTLDEEGEYGFIPVPVSESNPNSGKICTLVPGYFCVEGSTTTEEEQAAGKEFLNWLINSEEGQQYVIDCGNIPAYTNNEATIEESVSQSAVEYTNSGETFPMYVMYPSDHATQVGASMQKYLAGEIDRSGLAQEISDYWASQE